MAGFDTHGGRGCPVLSQHPGQHMPRNLLQKRNPFSGVNIPYIYFTVKYRCFQGASQEVCTDHVPPKVPGDLGAKLPSHSCVKPCHSCLRNIVSFIKVLGRKTFKKIGRAFIFGLASVCPRYSIRNLSTGKDVIEAELKKQLPRIPLALPVPTQGRPDREGHSSQSTDPGVSGAAAASMAQSYLPLMRVRRLR